ncbi:hypothetical protein NPIL_106761 [Nephila pilipes]|uniref:Uncharacterized protein n=1 Tax=Nephila pilipes TaxID=299642 RepID=A0A8X6U0I1_NEPPI|nr:hypothetical protein NPIL_106761 [Nephila pilipes]
MFLRKVLFLITLVQVLLKTIWTPVQKILDFTVKNEDSKSKNVMKHIKKQKDFSTTSGYTGGSGDSYTEN